MSYWFSNVELICRLLYSTDVEFKDVNDILPFQTIENHNNINRLLTAGSTITHELLRRKSLTIYSLFFWESNKFRVWTTYSSDDRINKFFTETWNQFLRHLSIWFPGKKGNLKVHTIKRIRESASCSSQIEKITKKKKTRRSFSQNKIVYW